MKSISPCPIGGLMGFAGDRILCVMSHPDDETIGCGATLARAVREGAQVRVYLPFQRQETAGRDHWELALKHFRKAVDLLGAEPFVAPDLRPESDYWAAPHLLLSGLVPHMEWSTLVITHWHGDVHQSHRAVSQAVELGVRPFRLRRRVLQCEIPSSSDQSFFKVFAPNLYVEVEAEDADAKLRAMSIYESEHAPGRNPQALERWLKVRGEQIGAANAEAFCVARWFL